MRADADLANDAAWLREPVAVTGATGFVGRHFCERLVQLGVAVRAVVRDTSRVAPGVVPIPILGLHDGRGLAEAMRGVRTVIHLAARVHVMRDVSKDPLSEFRAINVEGTRAVFASARAADAARFVFLSSVKAVAAASTSPLTEDDAPHPVDPYGQSKLEAEELLRSMSSDQLRPSIVRSPLIYGAGVKGNMRRLFQLIQRRMPVPVSRHNRRSLVFVRNLVVAFEAILSTPNAAGETFFVSDGRDVSTYELAGLIGSALHRAPLTVALPERAMRSVARVLPSQYALALAERLFGSLVVSSAKLKRVTGFAPPYTMEEGLGETARWVSTAES